MRRSLTKAHWIAFLNDKALRLFMLILVLFSVFPFVYMFTISLMDTASMKLSWERLVNATYTLDNYKLLFWGDGRFGKYILNSSIVTIYACVVTCVVSSMAAYVFAKKRFTGNRTLYNLYVMTMMIPGQVILISQFLVVKKLGLLNTYTGIAIPQYYAYGVIMLRSFMKNLPSELFEAADIDGCSESRKFISIVIPLMKPALISLTIYTFFNVWGNLLWPLVVASGDKMTITQAIATMQSGMSVTHYGSMMAASTIAFLPPFILYLILQKQFVEGIAVSGLKG